MANPFLYSGQGSAPNSTGLVYDMVPVTPADGADNVGAGNIAIGLYCTAAGDVSFHNKDGVTRTVTVPANFYLVCSVKRVLLTGTTSTGIHAMVV